MKEVIRSSSPGVNPGIPGIEWGKSTRKKLKIVNLVRIVFMDNIVHRPMAGTCRVGSKSRRGRFYKNNLDANGVREPAGLGTLTRTKDLVNAAVRVWELKHRISR